MDAIFLVDSFLFKGMKKPTLVLCPYFTNLSNVISIYEWDGDKDQQVVN